MAEVAKQESSPAPTPSTEAPKETTLEDVYKTHNVEQMAQEFTAKPQPKEAPRSEPEVRREEPSVSVPDPVLDPAGYKTFMERTFKDSLNTKQALRKLESQLQEREQATFREREEADLRKAVSKVNEHLGDSKLPDDFVEVALGVEAKRDNRFFALWNNRAKNPKAFEEGMKAFAGKLGKNYSLRADPQIAENQRALREATSTKATTAPEPSMDEKLGKLSPADFRRAMDDIRNGRSPRGV